MTQKISREILAEKYAQSDEGINDVYDRCADALAGNEKKPGKWRKRFRRYFQAGGLLAGRIMAGAGTGAQVTLINCFVQPVGDSMKSIMRALGQAAETMRRGGGVGYDFSLIRPKGAAVKKTGSVASGPLSYMEVFNAMCDTISSKGSRRGAQMGVLRIDHPDIEAFIEAKAVPWDEKSLKAFNISVGTTDAFMEALAADADWELVHEAEPSAEQKAAGAYRRDDGLWVYRTVKASELWERIMRATYDHADPGVIFLDRMNQENNLAYCETIAATNPCGEQPLPPHACCCLGPINLSRLVRDPFTEKARFDWAGLDELATLGVRMLDNVLDVTYWPLEEQRREAEQKRRIGLGFTGLHDAMLMLGYRYDESVARDFAATVARAMRDAAYRASVELARKKGAFPLFDAEQYLASPFVQRLPEDIREAIRKHGIRNSHLLSIAPTGTVSLAFGDNCSSGIEPVFDWVGSRMVKQPDGSWKEYGVANHAYRQYRELMGDEQTDDDFIDSLPSHWVRAMDLPAEAHLAMVEAVAPYIDSAISKTINVAQDYPYEDFKQIYQRAWEKGLKGVTTYRPSGHVESVLKTRDQGSGDTEEGIEPTEDLDQSDPDRRVRLNELPISSLASLRWVKRPRPVEGNPAWTYLVDHPHGYRFAVFVGHIENGENYPFEVWVNGAEQPRGLGALAKSLSMDMRSNDREFLKAKLSSLEKTQGDDGFTLQTVEGEQPVPSLVSGFARLVRMRCEALGTFDGERETPVMDALLFRKEPKTGTDGTLSWSVDVRNENTGDDFVLTLKELTLPDGTRRPYSLWFSGDYPRTLDGLCKVLSWDMRVSDPAWIGAKLRQIADYAELRGDFWAKIPGRDRSRLYPSTIAYVAALVIHRHARLGILDEDGYPIETQGVVSFDDDERVMPLRAVGAQENRLQAGARCDECGNYAVIRKDGCDFCTACGVTGSCG